MNNKQLLQPGDLVKNQYQIISLIGKGGIGTTYLANDKSDDTNKVLKTLDLSEVKDWKEVELFEREIATLKNINHPQIPDYYDNFELKQNNKILYALVMQYIEGKNLYETIKGGMHFSEEQVCKILEELLNILVYIHGIKPTIIHRDINPKNIICNPQGRIFLVDFGAVGRIVADTVAASYSNTFVGTIGYMPPEQLYGKSLPASDIYSLGATILYLLTGKEPSSFRIKDMKLDYSRELTLSPLFKKLLDKMIEPSLEKRIKNATEVVSILRNEKKKLEIKQKQNQEISEQIPSLSEVDRIVEKQTRKRKQAARIKRQAQDRKLAKLRKKEQKQFKASAAASPRVFINKTDQGTLITIKKSRFFKFNKGAFTGNLAIAILIFIFSLALILPVYFALKEELFNFTIDPVIEILSLLGGSLFLILIGTTLFSNIKRLKTLNILITGKGNVLVYRKNPRKPLYTGKKHMLVCDIDESSFAPGQSGNSTKAWKKITFKLKDHEFKDCGFTKTDADTIRSFCKENKIKSTY